MATVAGKGGVPEGARKIKVVLLGTTSVGKTCLVNRYVQRRFTESVNTIGGALSLKILHIDDLTVCLEIWDTAGQERFRSLIPIYYRDAVAAILVLDVTDDTSFESLKEFVTELKMQNNNKQIAIAISCNKIDRPIHDRKVSMDEVRDYAKALGAQVHETSAKSGKGIEALFNALAKEVLERSQSLPRASGQFTTKVIQAHASKGENAMSQKSKCC